MQSRKDFLRNSGITFAGILLSNQLSAFTKTSEVDNTISIAVNQLTIAGKHCSVDNLRANAIQSHQIIFDENNAASLRNLVCNKTGKDAIKIDAPSFNIVQHNNMKVGIVTVSNVQEMKKADTTASLLKKEYGCNFVVCVSSIGFKNSSKVDDINLANESTHIDTILSTDEKNYCKYQYVANNSAGSEIYIVNNINDNKPENSFVSIAFDKKGNRQAVTFA